MIMFISLGIQNAWRNRSKFVPGIISMCIAAIIFTVSVNLSKGYPPKAYFPARQMLAGDIILVAEKYMISQEDIRSQQFKWEFAFKSLDMPTSFLGLDQIPYIHGYISGVKADNNTVTPGRIEEVAGLIGANRIVKNVAVKMALPCLVKYGSQSDGTPRYMYAFLEARDVVEDINTWNMPETVVAGSYFGHENPGQIAGVVCRGWMGISLQAGEPVSIEIPLYRTGWPDYENCIHLEMQIMGSVAFQEGVPGGTRSASYRNPSIFVTEESFRYLCHMVECPVDNTRWGIAVTLNDLSNLENIVSLFQREYPEFTVLSVPSLAETFISGFPQPTGIPMDMSLITQILAFITAALLSATNLSVLMLGRKTEIGILRSLGATSSNIITMVLAESMFVSFTGAILRILITRPLNILTLILNKIDTQIILAGELADIGTIMAYSLGVSIVFGLMPVAKALKATPSQVLREN